MPVLLFANCHLCPSRWILPNLWANQPIPFTKVFTTNSFFKFNSIFSHSPGPCSHGYNLIPMALGALIYLVYLSECWSIIHSTIYPIPYSPLGIIVLIFAHCRGWGPIKLWNLLRQCEMPSPLFGGKVFPTII
jgi:hypothetical protein